MRLYNFYYGFDIFKCFELSINSIVDVKKEMILNELERYGYTFITTPSSIIIDMNYSSHNMEISLINKAIKYIRQYERDKRINELI